MNETEIPTPRTDECLEGREHGNAIEFLARQLEREIAAMREAIKAAHEALGRVRCWDLCNSIWGRPCDCGREAAFAKLQPFIN